MEAARVPWRMLGELFVEKDLITQEQLEEALDEQHETGKRLGEILVARKLVSPFELTLVVADQMGVELESQKGFGSGLREELKRRHARAGAAKRTPRPGEEVASIEDWLGQIEHEPTNRMNGQPAELEEHPDSVDAEMDAVRLRRRMTAIERELNDERAKHEAALELLTDIKEESATLAAELMAERERSSRVEAAEQEAALARRASASLSDLVAELRAEVSQLREAGAGAGSGGDAAAQVNVLEARAAALEVKLQESREHSAALEARIGELEAESAARDTAAFDPRASTEVVSALEAELAAAQALAAEVEEQRAALEEERDALARSLAEREQALDERGKAEESLARHLAAARSDLAAAEELTGRLRDEAAGLAARAQERDAELAAARAELERLREAPGDGAASSERAAALEYELVRARESIASLEAQRAAEGREVTEQLAKASAEAPALRERVGALESELAHLGEERTSLERRLVEAEARLAALQPRLIDLPHGPLDDEPQPVAEHVAFVPGPSGYRLMTGEGASPERGAAVEIGELGYRVAKVGRSPLPGDKRPCAFLECA